MIICLCHGVCDRTIDRLVASGARSVDELAARCGAGSDCWACGPLLESLVEQVYPAAYAGIRQPPHHPDAGGMPCAATIRSSTS
ncbi:MAG: (2Fe-2S)-binding protein [Candidatus Rokuibacteriota bacterium]